MLNNRDAEKKARRVELAKEYFAKFGQFVCLPFGVALRGTWTDDTHIREYEIALKMGIPLEPGIEMAQAVRRAE
jgi:hypothetical protein